ncbi:tandem-95 repeat protein [Colwelliaceae bacterium 6471]
MNTQILSKVAAAILPLGISAASAQPVGAYGSTPSYLSKGRSSQSSSFNSVDLSRLYLSTATHSNDEPDLALVKFNSGSLNQSKPNAPQKLLVINSTSSPVTNEVEKNSDHTVTTDLELIALNPTTELVIIDAALNDKSAFYQKSKPSVQVVEIQFGADALSQLKTVLQEYQNLDAVHLVSHAESGVILLGETKITEQLLREEIETLSTLDIALKSGGDLLLYGCNLADGESGESLIELIANTANIDVAASNNLTGNEALNGDWELEISRGSIDAELPFLAVALKDFSDVLVVTNGLKDFSGWAGTNSTTLSTTDFSMTGSDGTTNILKIIGTDAYLTNIGANTGSFMYLQADGVNTGSFELTGLVFDETANASAGVTNIYIKGYVSGGGTVTSSTLSGTAGADTFTFAAGQLGSFSGQQLTGFKVFFDATLTDYGSFKSFTVANAAAPNVAPTLTGAPANATVTEDVATDVNLSAITVADADGDSLTLTLTASSGTMAATSGGSVTVGGSGTGTMTLAGTAGNINTFLDTTTNIKYTTSSNDNITRNIAAKVNDGTVDSATSNITVNITAVGDTPSITNATTDEDTQSTSGLVVSRNAADSTEVTHFKITSISGGSLFKNDGSTAIANNEFITFAEANAGLKFTPTANSSSNGSFNVQSGTDAVGGGLSAGSATATITVNAVGDTPGITNASTNEDTQTSSGLVISKSGNDGAEVTHYKITSLTGGSLFKNDGTTAIANNSFITVAEGAAGLKFTPTANSTSNGSFDVQAGTDGVGGGLSAGTATATITVTAIGDTPSITNATTDEDVQSSSGLVVSRNAADSTEVTHFKITSISGGSLFKNDGTTAIVNNDFITFAEANAGLKFTPTANSSSNGSFDVQAGTDAVGGGLSAGTATATITVNAVGDTPSITNASTNEDTQSSSGLVISKNANDGAEVTHYKITNLTGGSLFKNDGSTAIVNNDFITAAEGTAGLKFTPSANSTSNGSFDVQAGTDGVGGGLSAGTATATITITAVNDAPTLIGVTNAGPSFAKGSSTAVQLDVDATVADIELDVSDDFSGATITLLRNGGANAEDEMSVQTAGSLTVAGGNISSGGNVIATINTSTPGQIVITFANNGTVPSGALVDEVIQNLTYKNTNAVNPGTLVRINYAFSDGNAGSQGTGGALTDSDDFVNITITNAPTFTNLDGGATFIEGGAAVVMDADASVADVELDALNGSAGDWTGALLTLRRNGGVNSDDVLTMQAGGGVTISGTNIQTAGLTIATFDTISTAGEMVITFTGSGATPTTALVQDVLNNIIYSNSSDVPATSITLDVIANDGTNPNTGTATVNITGVNDLPAFTGVDATPAFTEDGAAVVLDANAVIADAELDAGDNYNGATLQLQRNGGASADDSFANSGTLSALTESAAFNTGGLALGTVTTNSGGTLLLTFGSNATASDVDSVIQQIAYANANNAPSANVQINYTFNDGNAGAQGTGGAGLDSNDSITVSITEANDAPSFAGLDATPIFNIGGLPVILDADATVVDPELDAADTYDGATLTLIRNGGASANDVFSNTGTLSSLVQGNTFNVGGPVIGTVTTNSSGTLLLTFNAASTASVVDTVLQSITYSNNNVSPPANVLIDYTINDGTTIAQGAGGALSGNGSITVTLQANVAPVISEPSPQALSVSEDGNGSITLNATDGNGDTITWSISTPAANGTASASGTGASKAVSYTPLGNFNGADSFVVQVSDGKGGSDNLTVNVTVNPVNDLPTGTVNISGTAKEGETLTASNTLADVDGLGAISYAWKRGSTTIGSGTTYTIVEADVGSTITVTASYTDQDATQEAVVSTPTEIIVGFNEAPVAIDQLVTTAEDTALSATLSATDVNDDTLTYSVVSEPSSGTLSGTAPDLTYTPNENFFGEDSFTFTANDGTVDSNIATVNITVEPVNDAPIASADAISLTNWNVATIDVLANDSDADNDNLIIIGATADSGSVTFTDSQLTYQPDEGFNGTTQVNYTIKDAADERASATVTIDVNVDPAGLPIITAPENITINSTGLFTFVDLGVAKAIDEEDGDLAVSVDSNGYFRPGIHTVIWSTIDSDENKASASQSVKVVPQVGFSKNQKTAEGASVTVKAILNGPAVEYPVTVSFAVGGTANTDGSDHNLVGGSVTFEAGQLDASIDVDIIDDGAGEGAETLTVTMTDANNAVIGARDTHTIQILEGNVAPEVTLSAVQETSQTRIIAQDGGLVTVTSKVKDPNVNDQHSFDWSRTDSALVDSDGSDETFTFDPSILSPGFYKIRLTVSDGDSSGQDRLKLRIQESLPELTADADSDGDGIGDKEEGVGDDDNDGIPDFLDSANLARNVVQERQAESSTFLMETEPGLVLTLGEVAFRANGAKSEVSQDDVLNHGNEGQGAPQDEDYEYSGGLFDFNVDELPQVGQTVRIVVPQISPIPANAVYRKLMPAGWQDFVSDANNAVASAAGSEGFCPPPGDNTYIVGLTEGHWCVQLSIEDGGPNDADGEMNQSVDDPGGVAVVVTSNHRPVAMDDSFETRLNTPLTLDVLSNDSDEDGDTLTISSAEALLGSVTIEENMLFYEPAIGFLGQDNISYVLTDGVGGTDYANAVVQVQANQAPVANADIATVTQGEEIIIDVLANDTDIEGDSITLVSASALDGTVVINDAGTITYSASNTFEGVDTISYTIADAFGAQASSEVAVTVVKQAVVPEPEPEPKKGGGGSIGLSVLMLLAMRLMRGRFIHCRKGR